MSQPTNTIQNANDGENGPWLGASLVVGFASALVVWTAWFITHLPWLDIPEQARIGAILAAWLIASVVLARCVSPLTSLYGGMTSALPGLLFLGTKLVEPGADGAAGPVRPAAALIAGGFILLGGVLGLLGAAIGRALPRSPARHADWLARFALVTALTCAPLIFVGGLVTSTNSGMAVPDWPRTYGANMFLYPLKSAPPSVFLEHSHRLFGTLVGLASLVLLIWTLCRESRTWVKVLAGIAFGLVVFQGILGGVRVLAGHPEAALDAKFLRMVHGILAQVTLGTVVGLAAVLAPAFRIPRKRCSCGYPLEGLPHHEGAVTCPECGAPNTVEYHADPFPMQVRLRMFATGFLHASLLQLILGAAYRHFRDSHSLFSHLGFSLVVVTFGMAAAFLATSVHGRHSGLGPVIRRTGRWTVGVLAVQFILGWATFSMGGKEAAATSPGQALLRTVHQANGALLLTLAVLGFVWAKRLIRIRRDAAA